MMTKELKELIDDIKSSCPTIEQGMSILFLNRSLSLNNCLFSKMEGPENSGVIEWLNSEPKDEIIDWKTIIKVIVESFGSVEVSVDTCIYAYLSKVEGQNFAAFLEYYHSKIKDAGPLQIPSDGDEKHPLVSYINMSTHAEAMDVYFPFLRETAKNIIHIICETQRKIPHVISSSKFLRQSVIHELANANNELDCPIEAFPMEIYLIDAKEMFGVSSNGGDNDLHSTMYNTFEYFSKKTSAQKIVVVEGASFIMEIAGGTILSKMLAFARQFDIALITLGEEGFPEEVEGYVVDINVDEVTNVQAEEIVAQMSEFYLGFHMVDARPQIKYISSLFDRHIPEPKICNLIQLLEFACVKERNDKGNMIKLGFKEIAEVVGDDYNAFANKLREIQDDTRAKPYRLKKSTIEDSLDFLFSVDLNTKIKEIDIVNLEKDLNSEIFGQQEAVKKISESILRSKADLRKRIGPLAVFMMLGASGVGKTYTAKILQKKIYGDEKIIRLDMSEYSEQSAVSKIFGASAGYIGYDDGSKFLKSVKDNPRSVIIIDEIEKAHSQVINSFLHIFDEGHATSANGMKVDFSESIIILTGNIGSRELMESAPKAMGFVDGLDPIQDQKNKVENALKKLKEKFTPEFINRIHEIVFYNPLDDSVVKRIIKAKLDEIKSYIKARGFELEYSTETIDALLKKCEDPLHNGARLVDKIIRNEVENPLSKIVLAGKSGKITISDKIEFTFKEKNKKITSEQQAKRRNKGSSVRPENA